MEEKLISLKTAQLAKLMRFNLKTNKYYSGGILLTRGLNNSLVSEPFNYNKRDYKCYSVVTLSLMQQWLREVHGVVVSTVPLLPDCKLFGYNIYSSNYSIEIKHGCYYNHDTALEKGVQEALELIKIKL